MLTAFEVDMTPNQVKEMALSKFPILLFDNADTINVILKSALMFYQTKVAVIKQVEIKIDLETKLTTALPNDFLKGAKLSGVDGNCFSIFPSNNVLKVDITKHYKPPATLTYFANICDVDFDTYQLPPEIITNLQDYLEILIRIPNNELKSAISAQSEILDPTVQIHQELLQEKKELEAKMIAAAPPIPMTSFY
ncbi:hypothetical protein KO527_05425 [Pseudoalteromonas sp. C2R02]|uniref:hypothetical protein n=1 Tax=Pseudoalteromonas sp. C2R02 TaxID=2841565 RepID=UPI001C0985A9|nr:hypothetical protein [Pseudoalteromonas sp. C2R02]MBU2968789.1 hypothetical protein [Pseudoalteromonas sp. C2R02]